MKCWLLALLLLCSLQRGKAQSLNMLSTNRIVFPKLLSRKHTVLMTNAEFRCTDGNQVVFRNGSDYRSFAGADLATNVLKRLGLTETHLQADQLQLDAIRERYAEQLAAAQAQAARQASQTNALAKVVDNTRPPKPKAPVPLRKARRIRVRHIRVIHARLSPRRRATPRRGLDRSPNIHSVGVLDWNRRKDCGVPGGITTADELT